MPLPVFQKKKASAKTPTAALKRFHANVGALEFMAVHVS
jgi:hypothetical protein